MKKLLLIILAFCTMLTVISVSVSAIKLENYGIEIDIPSSYTVLTAENTKENADLLKKLNFNENSFKNYLAENKIVLLAVDDLGSEIVVKSYETDFTKSVVNFGLLEEAALDKVGKELLDNNFTTVEKNDFVFLRQEFSGTDKGGKFSGVQFVTVSGGSMYTISLTVEGTISTQQKNQADKLIKDFSVESHEKFSLDKFDNIITMVIISIGIIAFIAIAIYVVVLVVISIKEGRNTSDVAPYVKIKRRKF